MGRSFKLMSFNIQFGTDYAKVPNFPLTIQTIVAADPDIVALQEVDKHWSKRSGFADQVRILSEALGMHAVYGANLDMDPPEPGAPRRQYGTAVLSKYEIVGSRNYPLTSLGYEQRGLLETEIDLNGTRLGCYCIHMGLTQDQRMVQAGEARAIIGRRTGPVILAGDFNATPDSPELRLLLDGGLADCFAARSDVFTFPSEAPTDRIDYILYSGQLEKRHAAVLGAMASDHCPILAELAVK